MTAIEQDILGLDVSVDDSALVRAIEEQPEPPPPPEVPADVAAAPADATKTASGLAYKVLKPGTGTAWPCDRRAIRG